jgi:photosystem II stability/assembly factor-like uncharacterized protein
MSAFRSTPRLILLLALGLLAVPNLGAQSRPPAPPAAAHPIAKTPAPPNTPQTAAAPAIAPGLFAELRWRHIGPFRGGRTKAAVGVASQPNVFYIGAVNGGVWKTTDYGRSWMPIFDDQPTGSIGAIAVAPSNPDIIYVGSGEGMQRPDLSTGDGFYRSTNAGRTWTHLGLRDGQQIAQIDVDPRDPKRLFVAVLGHPYGPNPERGLYRSLDGGDTFQSVLYKDENTGAADVCIDPNTPSVVYAVLWQSQEGPWENAGWNGPGSGLFKSTDGGTTWRPLTKGLPTFAEGGLGRIGITVAPSDSTRLYATVEAKPDLAGIYRSDDAGDTWRRVNADPRVVARPDDAAEVRVHPKNSDIVFVPTIVAWKSVDGGQTFVGWRGAPGGDDYQRLWINPNAPDTMLLVADQGAIVTVNGGQTWSSWYNQPTAQMFHVNTDNAFPYRVCGGQQESGSACVQSRGDDGQITLREWRPVAVEEYGYAVPDPLNPDIVYGGKLTRYDRRTHQAQNVAPKALRAPGYRFVRTAPVVFSAVDPRILYFASNTLWKTADGGQSWAEISPDLTRPTWDVPASAGVYRTAPSSTPSQRGVIYTIAPSPIAADRIWAGTDDGLIHVTTDGGKIWRDVTPLDLKPWAKVSVMDASHFHPLTAFAAIDTMRLDDTRPHLYRTRDGGQSWTAITAGIPAGAVTRVIREDPKRKGLLFAGTEQAVYVSLDEGDHWQTLRGNMPATSIRDLVVKGDDIVVATHGRGFWILDDITPLRQASDAVLGADAHLFAPQEAMRWRWNTWTDTPLPPDEPAGQNPPDGAILHYSLRRAANGPVSIEIIAASGAVVRKYSSADPPEPPVEGRNIPDYWIRPAQPLSTAAGLHRFVWDLHYPAPAASSFEYPISAIYRNTWREPRGPWVLPGPYTVRLTVEGRVFEQPLVVKMDPRVTTPAAGLERQFALSMQMYEDMAKARAALAAEPPPARRAEVERAAGAIESLYGTLQEADLAPTPQLAAAVADAHAALAKLLGPGK